MKKPLKINKIFRIAFIFPLLTTGINESLAQESQSLGWKLTASERHYAREAADKAIKRLANQSHENATRGIRAQLGLPEDSNNTEIEEALNALKEQINNHAFVAVFGCTTKDEIIKANERRNYPKC